MWGYIKQSTHVLAQFKLAQALRVDALLHVGEEGSVELCNCAYPTRARCVVVGHQCCFKAPPASDMMRAPASGL